MKASCPTCSGSLNASNINIATDVAACPHCGEIFAASSLVSSSSGGKATNFNKHQPPQGVSFHETISGWEITASTRSPIAFFLVPFMLVWSGFSLGGIYGSQIVSGEFSLLMSLFGIPFFMGTIFLGAVVIMSICGTIVVAVDRNQGRIFTGVGPIGWTRNFDWGSITAIEETITRNNSSENNRSHIALIGQQRLKFGSTLSDEKRYYIVQSLRQLLPSRHN